MKMKRVAWAFVPVVSAAVSACTVTEVIKQPSPATYTAGSRQLTIGDVVTTVPAAAVTLDFFREAGAPPLIGRFFVEGDQTSSAQRVAVLSHDLWTRHFRAQPDAIGGVIELDGHPTTVVGVARRGFNTPNGAQLWTPRAER